MKITSAAAYPFRRMYKFLTRNLAFSNSFLASMGRPVYNSWTIKKAVKEGYKDNGWVYRHTTLAMTNGGSVPWGVVDKDGKRLEDHPLDKMLQFPNPHISRQELFQLWISWLELAGNALSLKVKAGDKIELWPISPDRIHPVTTSNIQEWIAGYSLDTKPEVKWKPEEILHFKYLNPADPYWGLAPLEAVSKIVDIDSDQKDWNKSVMQNMGIMSGIFTFKREFDSVEDTEEVAQSINDKYGGGAKSGNARTFGVLGGEAKFHRTGATAQELDFSGSRKDNMNEIFIVMGTPPQYAGSQDKSTYNNYQTSELIYWFQKIIPMLDDLKDTFNFSFHEELGDKGDTITYFLDGVPAIRRAMLERAKTAELLFNMGVPFENINKVFKFNIDKFDGWDESFPGGGKGSSSAENVTTSRQGSNPDETRDKEIEVQDSPLMIQRDLNAEAEDREEWAVGQAAEIQKLLTEQKRIINEAIENAADEFDRIEMINPEILLSETWEAEWEPVYNNIVSGYALKAAGQVIVEVRADDELKDALAEYLEGERVVLKELSLIESSTVNSIIAQVENGLAEGLTVNELQQSIIDAGIFEPPPDVKAPRGVRGRALRLSRTITGTAGSMGQFIGARQVGATHKKWVDSGFEVRTEHIERNNEPAVGINALFSPKFGALTGPRYPLDPNMPVGDRVNCRCSMTFEIRK